MVGADCFYIIHLYFSETSVDSEIVWVILSLHTQWTKDFRKKIYQSQLITKPSHLLTQPKQDRSKAELRHHLIWAHSDIVLHQFLLQDRQQLASLLPLMWVFPTSDVLKSKQQCLDILTPRPTPFHWVINYSSICKAKLHQLSFHTVITKSNHTAEIWGLPRMHKL